MGRRTCRTRMKKGLEGCTVGKACEEEESRKRRRRSWHTCVSGREGRKKRWRSQPKLLEQWWPPTMLPNMNAQTEPVALARKRTAPTRSGQGVLKAGSPPGEQAYRPCPLPFSRLGALQAGGVGVKYLVAQLDRAVEGGRRLNPSFSARLVSFYCLKRFLHFLIIIASWEISLTTSLCGLVA